MKYFVVSDIHSCYTALITSLKEAGYEENNSNHCLVICGDLFDRGKQTLEVYNFIMSIPETNRILVRGNHEKLYLDLLKKSFYPDLVYFQNGTVDTFCQIAGVDPKQLKYQFWAQKSARDKIEQKLKKYPNYSSKPREIWAQVIAAVKASPITAFIIDAERKYWRNYVEIGNYICIHSCLPALADWRSASDLHWRQASWECPWKSYLRGDFEKEHNNGKTIICGHYHTSDFFKNILKQPISSHDCKLYNYDGLVGLDAYSTKSEKVNVFVFEYDASSKEGIK